MRKLLNKGLFAMLFIAMICGFCSCNNTTTENTATQTLNNAYCYIIDDTTGKITQSTNLSLTMVYNYTNFTSTTVLNKLILPDGTSYTNLNLTDVPFKYTTEGWKVSSATTVKASADSSTSPDVTSYNMYLLERVYNDTYVPGFYIQFKIGNYTVQSSYAPFLFVGTTVSTPSTGDAYTTESSYYTVTLNHDTETATITITNARFHERMPEGLTMDFKDIPFSYLSDGSIILSADEVIPYIGNTPYNDQYPVTNLDATINPTTGMDLQFTCTVFSIPFSVSATVSY